MAEINDLEDLLEDSWDYLAYTVGDDFKGFQTVDRVESDDRRWARAIQVIVRAPSGKFYSFWYDHGLTEYQDDEYTGDVREVERTVKTVEVVEWVKI